jgi:hypothetical protein
MQKRRRFWGAVCMTAAVALGWSPAASATSMVELMAKSRLQELDGSSSSENSTSQVFPSPLPPPFPQPVLPLTSTQLVDQGGGDAVARAEAYASYGILRALASQSIDGPASPLDDSLADVKVTFIDTIQAVGGPGMDTFIASFLLDGTISASVLSGLGPATTTASYSVRVQFGDDAATTYASFLWEGDTSDALPGGASSTTTSAFEVNGVAQGGTMDPLPGGLFTTPSISFDLSKPLTISVEVSATATGLNEDSAVLGSTSDIGQSFEWDGISPSTGCIGDSGTDWCAFGIIPEPGTATLLTPLAALLALALRRARPLR